MGTRMREQTIEDAGNVLYVALMWHRYQAEALREWGDDPRDVDSARDHDGAANRCREALRVLGRLGVLYDAEDADDADEKATKAAMQKVHGD